uniref:Putative voltage gated chloride channel domain-containing protein n=1 Tax=Amblyomma triste TaxID=251400 RepID=A0A023G593_AMBTT
MAAQLRLMLFLAVISLTLPRNAFCTEWEPSSTKGILLAIEPRILPQGASTSNQQRSRRPSSFPGSIGQAGSASGLLSPPPPYTEAPPSSSSSRRRPSRPMPQVLSPPPSYPGLTSPDLYAPPPYPGISSSPPPAYPANHLPLAGSPTPQRQRSYDPVRARPGSTTGGRSSASVSRPN